MVGELRRYVANGDTIFWRAWVIINQDGIQYRLEDTIADKIIQASNHAILVFDSAADRGKPTRRLISSMAMVARANKHNIETIYGNSDILSIRKPKKINLVVVPDWDIYESLYKDKLGYITQENDTNIVLGVSAEYALLGSY